MNRRGFIKKLPKMGAALAVFNGMPLAEMALAERIKHISAKSTNDRVLVLIQMHGGNDGLNSIIPINQYDLYQNLRPEIALPDKGKRKIIELDSKFQLGLHPDLQSFKSMYDQGEAAIIQNVAYENVNQSHFRSTNIWMMGGGASDYYHSGWAGRYLENIYPDYPEYHPNDKMQDPLALEIGKTISLAFHRDNGIPAGLSIDDPEKFYKMTAGGGGGMPAYDNGTRYGDAVNYIKSIEQKSNQYAERLYEVYKKGKNHIVYPEKYPEFTPYQYANNPLAPQLKTIARLIHGGCRTKIFLAKMGGFDTHHNQVEYGEPTKGIHAALQWHLSTAVKAFYDDLKKAGIDDKVLTVTFSEFGRRAVSDHNGTDHGKAAPMFIFNKHLKGGVFGKNTDLNNLDQGNIKPQFDYRQVLTGVLKDWFEADQDVIQEVKFDQFVDNRVDLFGKMNNEPDPVDKAKEELKTCYPNPAYHEIFFNYSLSKRQYVTLHIFNKRGEPVLIVVNEGQDAGEYTVRADISRLHPGFFTFKLKAGSLIKLGSFLKE